MLNKKQQAGFSLLELLVIIIVVGVLTLIALPYYENAVQSARSTEAVIWWNRVKSMAAGNNISPTRAERIAQDVNEKGKLKYFTLQIVCRQKDNDELCWEAEFHLKKPDQSVQYYLATQMNFLQFVCVPQNDAGDAFCKTQSADSDIPNTTINEQPAYIIHY